jgi:hypothetical protein
VMNSRREQFDSDISGSFHAVRLKELVIGHW